LEAATSEALVGSWILVVGLLVDSARRALTLGQEVIRVEGLVWGWVDLVLVQGTTELAESSRARELQLLVERVPGDNVEVLLVSEEASRKVQVEG
jgi:hypothetical protein